MVDGHHRVDYAWTVVIGGSAMRKRDSRDGLGPGFNIDYTITHQRRFATWLRARNLIQPKSLMTWLEAAEPHEDGWLINTGDGIEWQANPDWLKLAEVGFVGLRCGE